MDNNQNTNNKPNSIPKQDPAQEESQASKRRVQFGLTSLSVNNRIAVYVLTAIIVIMGIVSYLNLPKEAAPEVIIPMAFVSTPYFGVSPSDIESQVTQPIEKELKGLSGVKRITSQSMEGYSAVTIEFDPGVEIDEALQKVRDRVDLAKKDLPDDAEEPRVVEINIAEFPILFVNISGKYSLVKLKEIAEDVKDQIETFPEVLEVDLSGGLEREVQVNVDLAKVKYYNISLQDVIDAARVDIAGPFGHFQLGQEDSARHNWAFDTAGNNEGILINSGWETAFAATSQNTFGLLRPSHSTALDFSDKAPKVTYFTPRFAGFQFALSWTPDTETYLGTNPIGVGSSVATAGSTGSPGSLRFGTGNNEITYTNAIDLGAHYSGELAGVGVTAQAGWGTVEAPDNVDNAAFGEQAAAGAPGGDSSDPNIYQAGLALTFGGFRVAGGWARLDHGMALNGNADVNGDGVSDGVAGLLRTDGHAWTVGGGYGTGPWAFAVSFLHGEEEGRTANRDKDENDIFQASASYALSPGLGLNVQYLHVGRDADVDGAGGGDSVTNAFSWV